MMREPEDCSPNGTHTSLTFIRLLCPPALSYLRQMPTVLINDYRPMGTMSLDPAPPPPWGTVTCLLSARMRTQCLDDSLLHQSRFCCVFLRAVNIFIFCVKLIVTTHRVRRCGCLVFIAMGPATVSGFLPHTPPPLEVSPPCNLPPPGGGGDRHFTVLLGNIFYGGLCSPSVTHTFLHCFPIASNQSPVCIL